MKKIKKWAALVPACLFLLSVSSCSLAKGTYVGQVEQTLGVSLEEGKNQGQFVYQISTQNSQQIFSKLNITINESRISYLFGKYNVKFIASISKTEDFANAISVEEVISVGVKTSSVMLSFTEKEEELEALSANNLYVKIEIVSDENDTTFEDSWVVLGKITISGGEKLKGTSNEEESAYLTVDFASENAIENALAFENVEISEGKLVASRLGQLAYIDYELNTKNEGNSFESLVLNISDSLIKSTTQEVEDDTESKTTVEAAKTYVNAYVSTDASLFNNIAGKIESTVEGVTEGTIDLSAAVSNIVSSKIFVRVELTKDNQYEIENPNDYLKVGKISFEGDESKKVSSYLSKKLYEEIDSASSVTNISKYYENKTRQDIVLKDGNKAQILTHTLNDDGAIIDTKESNLGNWEEKGIKYNSDVVAGLNENQLAFVEADNQFVLSDDVTHYKKGNVKLDTDLAKDGFEHTITVYVDKTSDNYYELVFDVEGWKELNTTTDLDGTVSGPNNTELTSIIKACKAKAGEISDRVFENYDMVGGGNVIMVNVEGQRELYIHTEKLIQRVSDLKTFKRK